MTHFTFVYRKFVVTAGSTLRPNTIYRVHVVVLPGSPDLFINALITKGNGEHIASDRTNSADAGSSNNLLLKVDFDFIN